MCVQQIWGRAQCAIRARYISYSLSYPFRYNNFIISLSGFPFLSTNNFFPDSKLFTTHIHVGIVDGVASVSISTIVIIVAVVTISTATAADAAYAAVVNIVVVNTFFSAILFASNPLAFLFPFAFTLNGFLLFVCFGMFHIKTLHLK